MTAEDRKLVEVFMAAQAAPDGQMFSYNILRGIRAVLSLRPEAAPRWRDTHTTVPCDGDDVIGYWTPDSNFGKRACMLVHYFRGKWCEPGQPHLICGMPDYWMPPQLPQSTRSNHGA